MLTPGQDHDLTCALPLLENTDPGALLADKAYDADPLIGALNQRAITPVIPPKANRKVKRDCDFALYCERNLGRGSTIVTSQLPVDHWHEVIVDPTIADAVLDRLVHTAHRPRRRDPAQTAGKIRQAWKA